MTRDEFEYLQSSEAQQLIEANIDADPSVVALRLRNPAVATQIKNLQKCRAKLPTYYASRCVIPTVSYEQSSSELAAFSKGEKGGLAIDLTCGLGVDSYALSRSFDRVIAVEIDALRAEIARYNFGLLGVNNVDVVCSSAEDYLATTPVSDLIYVDPSRRAANGRSVYAVEQCQPNVIDLLPLLRQKTSKIVIKLSPLFDVEECYRLFGNDAHCTVISVQNECKEVVITISSEKSSDLTVIAIRDGMTSRYDFLREQIGAVHSTSTTPRYLCVPDVGFYKSRTISAMMNRHNHCYSGGYVLMGESPSDFCGAVYRIDEIMPYQPKILRKRFAKATVHIRDFPYTIEQIDIKTGGAVNLFFSKYCGEPTVFLVTLQQK